MKKPLPIVTLAEELMEENMKLEEKVKELKEQLSKIKIVAYNKYGMTSKDLN